MPRRSTPEPSDRAAAGESYIMDCAAKVHRACHKYLMERDPKYEIGRAHV